MALGERKQPLLQMNFVSLKAESSFLACAEASSKMLARSMSGRRRDFDFGIRLYGEPRRGRRFKPRLAVTNSQPAKTKGRDSYEKKSSKFGQAIGDIKLGMVSSNRETKAVLRSLSVLVLFLRVCLRTCKDRTPRKTLARAPGRRAQAEPIAGSSADAGSDSLLQQRAHDAVQRSGKRAGPTPGNGGLGPTFNS